MMTQPLSTLLQRAYRKGAPCCAKSPNPNPRRPLCLCYLAATGCSSGAHGSGTKSAAAQVRRAPSTCPVPARAAPPPRASLCAGGAQNKPLKGGRGAIGESRARQRVQLRIASTVALEASGELTPRARAPMPSSLAHRGAGAPLSSLAAAGARLLPLCASRWRRLRAHGAR